jgi:hypothetical protein
MTLVWERRVLVALLAERGAPLWERVREARWVATGPLRRWARRAGFVLMAASVALLTSAVLALELVAKSL